MYIKSALLTILMAILPLSGLTGRLNQHKLVSAILSAENASFIVKTMGKKVYVVTFEYQNAAETCKFLQKKGITVITVRNYGKINGSSFKIC